MSRLQAAALVSELDKCDLTAVEKARVATEVAKVTWATPEDAASVLDVLAEQPHKRRRRCNQNFLAIHNYLTDSQWQGFAQRTLTRDAVLNKFLFHAMSLGLRCPTEPSIKWITSLWLCLTSTDTELANMDPVAKALKLKAVKSTFDDLRKKARDPPDWIETLPVDPAVCAAQHPSMYNALFSGDATPAKPHLDMDYVQKFNDTYCCRGGLRSAVPTLTTQVVQPTAGACMLEKMAMGLFQAMSQQQQTMLQLMGSGQHHRGGNFASLSSLADRLPPPTALQMTPLRALSDGVPLALESGGYGRIEEVTTLPAPPVPALPAPPATSARSSQDAGKAPGDITEMFEMLQARKADAKAKAKSQKAAKTEEPDDEAYEASEAAAAKAAAKAKPPVAAGVDTLSKLPISAVKRNGSKKVMAASRDKATALATPTKPAKSKETAKPPVTPSKSKGNGKGKRKVAPIKKWEASMGYGCSKCRWSRGGCGRCRAEDFAGFCWNSSM